MRSPVSSASSASANTRLRCRESRNGNAVDAPLFLEVDLTGSISVLREKMDDEAACLGARVEVLFRVRYR